MMKQTTSEMVDMIRAESESRYPLASCLVNRTHSEILKCEDWLRSRFRHLHLVRYLWKAHGVRVRVILY